jgi:hypothetical protein
MSTDTHYYAAGPCALRGKFRYEVRLSYPDTFPVVEQVVALCEGLGDANLMAKLLNDHKRRTQSSAA